MVKKSEKVKAALKELSGKVYNMGIVGSALPLSFCRLLSSMDLYHSWCTWELFKRINLCTRCCSRSSELCWLNIVRMSFIIQMFVK